MIAYLSLPTPFAQILGRLRILRRLIGYAYSKYGPESFRTKVEGSIMYFPKGDVNLALLMSTGLYEQSLRRFIHGFVKKGMVVVDIGAGFGYYTLLFAKLVGNRGRVHAFEPIPLRYNFLLANVIVNKLTNVFVKNLAISNRSGLSKFYVHGETSSLVYKKCLEDVIDVNTITLDEYFEEYGEEKVDLIKIDAEGAEPYVILGAEETLKKTKIIISEFFPEALQSSGYPPAEYLKMVINHNFSVFVLGEDCQVKSIEDFDLISHMNKNKPNCTHLICFKRRN
jgi:FkbM family methyltransferase